MSGLSAAVDAAAAAHGWLALTAEPWLEIEIDPRLRATRYLEIRYRTSLFDDPVRPILRFETREGRVERILPGPVAGAGVWRGPAPSGLEKLLISPAARPGPFNFAIESLRPLGLGAAIRDVAARRPGKLASIALARAFGYRAEADNALLWANGADPVSTFREWVQTLERPLDIGGFDRPRHDWATGPRFLVVIEPGRPEATEATLASVREQIYPHVAIGEGEREAADYVLALRAGDRLASHALAAFAEFVMSASARPQAIYADEIVEDAGGFLRPAFKPNWSPVFAASRDYAGRAAIVAGDLWAAASGASETTRFARAFSAADAPAHLRRLLLARAEEQSPPPAAPPAIGRAQGRASIVILTRDRPDLIGPCLKSLRERPAGVELELIIVDNGTRDRKALRILEQASRAADVTLIERPEPFNFAAFNNEATKKASGETLIFLNNDTEAACDDWAAPLVEFAARPDIGAVGGLLLFPDGRVQHCGVVVGLGEEAGHFDALRAPDAPSWLGRRAVAHEVSAVTGACLAVAREKFEAVGGFDAERLPVESNDIDLCLRLAERGWRTLYTPQARLYHKESASRGGAATRPLKVYQKERDWFFARWRALRRDDPYFHPGLALFAREEALPATFQERGV